METLREKPTGIACSVRRRRRVGVGVVHRFVSRWRGERRTTPRAVMAERERGTGRAEQWSAGVCLLVAREGKRERGRRRSGAWGVTQDR